MSQNNYIQVHGDKRRRLSIIGAVALVALLICAALSSAASADETHLFDPVLSLTGDCSTATVDPVPDPGCPGGVHPPKPFQLPRGIATDEYGNRYVASYVTEDSVGSSEGRIDVFDPSGTFITEISNLRGPLSLAVDSKGNLYVRQFHSGGPNQIQQITRFAPIGAYQPEAGEIEYGTGTAVKVEGSNDGIAINQANGHLFADEEASIVEFGSADEGNPNLGPVVSPANPGYPTPTDLLFDSKHIAVDAANGRIYASSLASTGDTVVRVFNLDAPHELLVTLDGSNTPAGKFVSDFFALAVAAEEETGHVFVADLQAPKKKAYEFDLAGNLVSTIEKSGWQASGSGDIGVDNGLNSPTRGYLFVPSGEALPSRSLAFGPKTVPKPPVVESVSASGITEEEAVLKAKVNPAGLPTTYRLEYTTQQQFDAEGFSGAVIAREGSLAPETVGTVIAAAVTGLQPGTAYRFRTVAHSDGGDVEDETAFATYRLPDQSMGCPNATPRLGLSAALPDCRAYELVTPTNTNGHQPKAATASIPTQQVSGAGDKVSFRVEWGPIPGFEGTGWLKGDSYLAARGEGGWNTSPTGPNGVEAPAYDDIGISPDQGYSLWNSTGEGTTEIEGSNTVYLRFPDGHSELLGQGSAGFDPRVLPTLITPNASHVIFTSAGDSSPGANPLEPEAAARGVATVYDRTSDGKIHVVSILPGGSGSSTVNSSYVGASPDGLGVAFRTAVASQAHLYLRYGGETYDLGIDQQLGNEVDFAGIAEGGSRIFYVKGEELLAFEAKTGETIQFTAPSPEPTDPTVVNVSTDGTVAYFVSQQQFPVSAGPTGNLPQSGAENLYRSDEGDISFVGTVTERDVKGENPGDQGRVDGLGIWTEPAGDSSAPGANPSRATADGGVLLFTSRANLTGYDSAGVAEIYRYDAAANSLTCISCSPTLSPSNSSAALMPYTTGPFDPLPLDQKRNALANLTADGKRAFFESSEALVRRDTNGLRDVYEWEAEGIGSCRSTGGCVYLISSGQSSRPTYLFAVSDSGDDVFISTSDLLTPQDTDDTPSVYDARVGGGFAPPTRAAGECLGEACQPAASPPSEVDPPNFPTAGNVRPQVRKTCAKERRKVRRGGKVRCVRPHRSKQHQKRANPDRRTSR